MRLPKIIPATCLLLGSIVMPGVNAATSVATTPVFLFGFTSVTPGDAGTLFYLDEIGLSGLPQFDPASGVLASATLAFTGEVFFDYASDSLGVANDALANSVDVEVKFGVASRVPYGGSEHLNPLLLLSDTGICSAGAGLDACSVMGGNFFESTGLAVTPSGTFTGAELEPFLGGGDLFDIEAAVVAGVLPFAVVNQDGPALDIGVSFDGVVSVTYEYAPLTVPLPAALWLFFSGLAGLAVPAVRRRIAVR